MRPLKIKTGSINVKKKPDIKNILCLIAGSILAACMLSAVPACVPTYPKEELPGAVKEVCKIEYDMDVEVTVVGSTMGIYYPMTGLLDAGLGVSEEAWDTISNLLLIASRVVLSTDADIQFYCVITQDARLPELQVVIIKYVGDVKRSMYQNISRTESFKRTLFSINLTPQAEKERSIERIFDKLHVEDQTRQKVLDEFFRSPPTKLSDIGYWRGNFYLKNITMGEFLAAQIANRIKIDFRADQDLMEMFDYRTAESSFGSANGKKNAFFLKFKIADQSAEGSPEDMRLRKVQEIIKIANRVVAGYKFKNFEFLSMDDQLENVNLSVSGENVYDFNAKKMSIKEIVQAPPGYF